MARGGNIGNGNFVRGTGQRGRGGSNTRGNWRGRGNFKSFRGGRGRGRGGAQADKVVLQTQDGGTSEQAKIDEEAHLHALDEKLGFLRFQEGSPRVGWLVNMKATVLRDEQFPAGRSAVDFYFIQEDGGLFKSTLLYEPYFFLVCKKGYESQVEEYLLKRYEGTILRLERKRKEDLKLPNHLLGYRRTVIQLVFRNTTDLFTVRREVLPIVQSNQAKMDAVDAYAEVVSKDPAGMGMDYLDDAGDAATAAGLPEYINQASNVASTSSSAATEHLIDIREYDVPYALRVCIDKDIRVGLWYTVQSDNGEMHFSCLTERVERNDPVVLVFDIETTKAPLKFPESSTDQIMMISYMIDGQGYLITNREIVSEDIEDFEYTPRPEYEGPFIIFNEADEKGLLVRFFEHWREVRPTVTGTYNGDFFDFPFIDARAKVHKMDLLNEIGFTKNNEGDYVSRCCAHMDAFRWVKRDSYLPQGSQGLKAVTTAKLGYNPDELDPELMTPYAVEQPHVLAQYSVSDAVATYYLYMKYVHPFIFSLCNIIPLTPDEVLRKGTGTLCETLLMVEAWKGEILMPNRHAESHGTMFEGHLLESETYVGGHVEALEAGIFRSDIETDFKIIPTACQKLIDELERALKFAIIEENKVDMSQVLNYDEVKGQIQAQLEDLRDNPMRQDKPLIYHLDVAAMYPNIMLSNRLQPDSIVDEAMCAACDYNRPGKECDRRMTWAWRGEYFPAKLDEYKMVRNALESERFPPKWPSAPERRFVDLAPGEQTILLHKRLGDYSRKVYAKTHETRIIEKESIICQRENPFYVDTVRAFRDRRYTYKGLHKDWKKNLDKADSLTETTEAKKMIVLYDSLQLAHKCILNSFYGYVMRKGARWHSMEMAGITCLTGATIIQLARQLVEQIGRPLELDTDGIWCMLPSTFPDHFSFQLTGGKKLSLSYPCTMLNHLVHDKFTNHQYHDLTDPVRGTYEVHSENSIFFELDGPYRAMILPASKEEDKLLKKRYAVFEEDGSLAELKGFEVKRRGELQLIKIFQSAIFERFLEGATLKECYAAVATIADKWLDVLMTKGGTLPDEELVDLIAENRSMSKTLAEYAGQKSTSISTARRLAEFLGEQMVKDKGLACKFIISQKPQGAPVTERAVPVAIFDAEDSVKQHFLRKWLKDNGLTSYDLRDILDWDYYIERLGSVIQKLITIPAALQRVPNPVPRIHHPDWLAKRVTNLADKFKQHSLTDMFAQQKLLAQQRLDAGETPIQKLPPAKVQPKAKPTAKNKVPNLSTTLPKGPEPDFNVDYASWIEYKKPFWRKHRQEKKALQQAGVSISNKGGKLGSMLRNHTFSLDSHVWDIVQITEVHGRPGEFKVWLLIRNTLQAVKLHVPRQFLINLKAIGDDQVWPDHCEVEAISKTLPRSHRAYNLVRLTTSEEAFLQQESAYSALLNRPEVDAVYETQVPLLVRALLSLGTTCMSTAGVSLAHGLDKGFTLDHLIKPQATLARHHYLDAGRNLNYIYFYYARSDNRHFMGLLFPNGRARLLVVERGNNRDMPNVEKYYRDQMAAVLAKGAEPDQSKNGTGVFDYPPELRVETTFHPAADTAFRAVSRELTNYFNQRAGPAALVIYTTLERSYFEDKIPATAQYPLLMISTRSADNSFTALGWRQPTCRRMIQHYLKVSGHIRHQIARADAFDIPLCNLERDDVLFCADIDFARRLSKSDMALWWSESPKPDLGGRESDHHSAPEDLTTPELSRPGCFTNACLEVELRDLAVDAVLQSALVYELEGAEGATVGFTETSHNLDEYAKGETQAEVNLGDAVLPQQTFALIKSMVKSWWNEAGKGAQSGSRSFRRVLDHLWRWISSPSARLFDPAIHRFVHGLMRKTFSQLVAEFRRLGADVVYADFSRMFLLTGKPNANMAFAYSNYIVTSINSRELFKYVSLSIMQYWNLLLWMDVANFGGVTCSDPLAEDEESIAQASEIDMNWNIATFLPAAVRPSFRETTAAFVHGLQASKAQAMAHYRSPLRVVQNTMSTQPDPKNHDQSAFLRDFMSHNMTRRLLKEIQDLQKRHAHDAPDEDARALWDFPQLPGSHLPMKNAILEFIKFSCAILGLCKETSAEVGILRRNLLDLISVREFSAQAAFRNPAVPFKVDMVCQYCTTVRSLDLTRDADLLSEASSGAATQKEFPCLACNHLHDPLAIEATLVEQLMQQLASYQLSDLKCSRCQQVKSNNLALHCHCSGRFQTVDSRTDLLKKLRTISSVAEYYSFQALHEAVEWVTEHL